MPSDDEDENSVSWADLHDAIDFCRRESLETFRRASNESSSHLQYHHNSSASMSYNLSSSSVHMDHSAASVNCGIPHSESEASLPRDDDDLAPARARPRTSYADRGGIDILGNVGGEAKIPGVTSNNSEVRRPSWDDLGDEIERATRLSLNAKGGENSNLLNLSKEELRSDDEGEAPVPSLEEIEGPWSCSACTFLNENPLHLVCGVCGTAKVSKRALQPSFTSLASGPGEARTGSNVPLAAAAAAMKSTENGSFHSTSSQDRKGSGRGHRKIHSSTAGLKYPENSSSHSISSQDRKKSGRGHRKSKSRENNSFHSSSSQDRKPSAAATIESVQDHDRKSKKVDLESEKRPDASSTKTKRRERRSKEKILDDKSNYAKKSTSDTKSNDQTKSKSNQNDIESSFRSADNDIHDDILNEIEGIQGELEASIKSHEDSQNIDDLRSSLLSLQDKVGGLKMSLTKGGSRRASVDSVDVEDLRQSLVSNQTSSSTALLCEGEFEDSVRSLKNDMKFRHLKSSDVSSSSEPIPKIKNRLRHSSSLTTPSVDDDRKSRGRLTRSVSHGSHSEIESSLKSSKSSLRNSSKPYRRSSVEFDIKDDNSLINDGMDQSYYSYSDDDDRTTRTMQTIKSLRVPEKEATIIYTDVQGSTALWESHPLAMKKATDVHDSIIRRCYADHSGYEISTEGDSFNLAFQHPADAIGFALKAQLALYKANWPEDILNHPDGNFNEKKAFRGFRVRMGMHHGPVVSSVHETTGRTIYQGQAVDIAKSIEKMSHGGQILTTVETWRAVSGMAEQHLGKPQVMDCGEHLLYDPKKKQKTNSSSKERYPSKRILQLVPNQLAYDFFAARGGQEVKEGESPQRVCGRVFPPLLSHGQLSTSFLNAPFVKNRVAMVFVYTDKMELAFEHERKRNQKYLAKYIRKHLMQLSPPGYECQEDKGSWMLAFDRTENGIKFALELNETVAKSVKLRGEIDKTKIFKIGIHWGPFLSMGPHTITGHADYFGPIVNRAARVAAQCEPGQVCVGIPMDADEEPPDPGPTVEIEVLGVKQLKGISTEMAIFLCRKKEDAVKQIEEAKPKTSEKPKKSVDGERAEKKRSSRRKKDP